jgi:hypothetical protein
VAVCKSLWLFESPRGRDKTILGTFLERKLIEAMEESQVHGDLFKIIKQAVDAANPALLKNWVDRLASWEKNPQGDMDCPYVPQHRCTIASFYFWSMY